MDTATLFPPRRAGADTDILPSYFPAPGLGLVPINAYLIRAKEPVLVDTGLALLREAFVEQLATLLPIASLRWIWLTHADQDHVGAIHTLLERAPRARVVTTYVGLAKMSLFAPLPIDRVYLLNPGERLEAGDRHLVCLRPPVFDAPETTALFDAKTRTLFSSDSFGAVLQQPVDAAEAMPVDAMRRGMERWASIDSPWLECADAALFEKRFDTIRSLAPKTLLSTHLPPAHGITDALVTTLIGARKVPPFVGPNQIAFEQLLRQAAE
jgi:flavorubredoxin